MSIILKDAAFREEFNRILSAHFLQLFTTFSGFLYLIGASGFHWIYLLEFFILIGFYKYYFQTIRRHLYSYWSFSFLLFIYLLFKIYSSSTGHDDLIATLIYSSSFLFLVYGCHSLSSPIFYPRIHWWEYDFRYRGDLKIQVSDGGAREDGRLTDLRRGAGCVILFQEKMVGDMLTIFVDENNILLGRVATKRENIIGRGYSYGVKFIFDSTEQKINFNKLANDWKTHLKRKQSLKFINDEN